MWPQEAYRPLCNRSSLSYPGRGGTLILERGYPYPGGIPILGYSPGQYPWQEWGTPPKGPGARNHGKDLKSVTRGYPLVNRQTNWKYYLPHSSDAGVIIGVLHCTRQSVRMDFVRRELKLKTSIKSLWRIIEYVISMQKHLNIYCNACG